MMDKIGGRKFVAAALISLVFAVLLILNRMTVSEFQTALEWIYGLFVVGNMGEHFSDSIK